jgi:DNA adenine methylase
MGSKEAIADWVIGNFPTNYSRYVEVFGGTARILLAKTKSDVEIYNDFNTNLANLFEVIRTKKDEFVEQLNSTIISEDLYNHWFLELNEGIVEKDDRMIISVERALKYFYIMSFTFKGKFTGGFCVIPDKNYCEKLQEKINTVNWIHQRIKNCIITNKSYEKVITANNNADTLLFLDPPYVGTEQYYEKLAGQFTKADHIKLRDLLKKHKGKFVLSYEADPFCNDLYSDFYILGKEKFRQGKGEMAEEILVTNFRPQATLFEKETLRNTISKYNFPEPELFGI